MSYNHKVVDGVDVLELDESIDLYSTPIIKKFLKSLLTEPSRKIVIAMESVKFIDSSGLGMLVNLFFECKQKKIGIKLGNLSSEAQRIITLAKKQDKFEIYPTVKDAIESFK